MRLVPHASICPFRIPKAAPVTATLPYIRRDPRSQRTATPGAVSSSSLSTTDSLRQPADREQYEVLLLLNNCTDASAQVARRFAAAHVDMHLHVVEHTFAKHHAHVGSARSLLMQQAALRLRGAPDALARSQRGSLLLTTDADTVVDPLWLAETEAAFARGADAVGGDIHIAAAERYGLARQARRAYALDRRYLRAVCLLESLLDPLAHDPWPRHHHHFGASLACTLYAYDACGGMQPTPFLEDLAFYRALVGAGMRFRHEPKVRVYTSARTRGRAPVGLSEQLRHWHGSAALRVPSCTFHQRRCVALAALRRAMQGQSDWQHVSRVLRVASQDVRGLGLMHGTAESAWQAIDGDTRIRNGLSAAEREGEIHTELGNLQEVMRQLRPNGARLQADTSSGAVTLVHPTTAASATHRVLRRLPAGSPLREVSSAPAAGPLLEVGVGQ